MKCPKCEYNDVYVHSSTEYKCHSCGYIIKDSQKTSTKNNTHPTKRPVQTDSGEGLSKDGNCSASSTEAKTGDIIMTGCPDEMEELFGNDSNHAQ